VNAAVFDLLALVASFAVMLLFMRMGYRMGKRRLLGETQQERWASLQSRPQSSVCSG
jgi:hypothetical protein